MSENLPICPKCGSSNIGQYRMITGPIWCSDCGYRVEKKEIDKSFYKHRNKANKE